MYTPLVAAISGAFGYLYTNFTPVTAHEKLEQRVINNEKEMLKEKMWGEIYFLKSQIRKYPNDQDLQDQLRKAEERLRELEK